MSIIWIRPHSNNAFFFVLFLQGRLFADMGLQVVYFALGVYGWLNWVVGGENKTALKISRTPRREWVVLLVAIPPLTWALREIPGDVPYRRARVESQLAHSKRTNCVVKHGLGLVDENDSRIWAENTIRWLGRAPDAVFTSEAYGEGYAELMGSKHISVDKPRGQVPISGTAVRNDPYAHWDFIEPPVRGWFAKRVCVLGAESTGTTTLAKALADHLQTAWVEEYGREYSELRFARNEPDWRTDEFTLIAEEQARREDAAARQANRVLICDTNAFATVLWHRRYMGSHSQAVEEIARRCPCDLYLLTGEEIPFVQDGLRDGEHIRREMHRWFEQALAAQPVPWHIVRGSHLERLREAVCLTKSLFKESTWSPSAA